jgi:hypothetical protein
MKSKVKTQQIKYEAQDTVTKTEKENILNVKSFKKTHGWKKEKNKL